MGWVHSRTSQTITWLECYGIYREGGVNQYKVQELLDGDSAFVLASQADMQAGADAARAESIAATEYAGEALAGIGAVLLAVGDPVTAIIGAIVAVIGILLAALAEYFYTECDKYHCGGHDRETSEEKRRYRHHIKALVGISAEEGSVWTMSEDPFDCGCSRYGHICSFVKWMHDGLVINGLDWDFVGGEPSKSGAVRGANAITEAASRGCYRHWRDHDRARPLMENGDPVPWGGENWPIQSREEERSSGEAKQRVLAENIRSGSARAPWDKPWLNNPDTYYYRAWRVAQVLKWMQSNWQVEENILCRTMECMEEVLEYTVGVEDDDSFNQKRRRGSRWYASIVWMMRDIWEAAQHMVAEARTPEEGWTKFGQVLQDARCREETLDELRAMAAGKTYEPEEVPWPWWPLFKKIPFFRMRIILMKLKPHFPYVYEKPITGPQAYGERAREASTATMPMLGQIRTAIEFGKDMHPIPARIAKGPSLGVIGVGLGAAVIGTYAIYKLLAPVEE